MSNKIVVLDGSNFSDLISFYDEVESLFTRDLGWKIGRNFNAFNDVLRGGFGVFKEGESIILIWKNIEKSRIDLGFDASKKYYEEKILTNKLNSEYFIAELEKINNNEGQSLFDIFIEIIKEHNHIEFLEEL